MHEGVQLIDGDREEKETPLLLQFFFDDPIYGAAP